MYFSVFLLSFVLLLGCNGVKEKQGEVKTNKYEKMRMKMIENQIKARGIKDPAVLEALQRVPRHRFVPENLKNQAYSDEPLPIGSGQTISQPYIVAYMTEQLDLNGDEKVLEVGTGSGYQAAVLAELAGRVYTIEILPELADKAQQIINELGYENVEFKVGNGYFGWPEHAPFDAIIVTAAPEEIPDPLVEQLKLGGRMIIPVGDFFQELYLIEKTEEGIKKRKKLSVRFVPLQREPEK
jgi:protein-L-isoaspartate(D-aspartate) O-methyltransferase